MAAQDLPTEIWVEILSPLWPCKLINPCLVSRRLCSVAQPMLYRNPDLMADGSYPSCLHLFLRTLLTPGREYLASHVRELSLCWDGGDLRSDDPEGPCFSAALARGGLPDGVLTGAVQVMLLLQLLPRLLMLDVIPPSDGNRSREFLDNRNALRPTGTLPIGLQSLRHFTSRFYGPSRTALLALLSLPNIHTIEVPLCFWRSFSLEQLLMATTMSSSVKDLTFDCGRISDASLTTLLGVPTALTLPADGLSPLHHTRLQAHSARDPPAALDADLAGARLHLPHVPARSQDPRGKFRAQPAARLPRAQARRVSAAGAVRRSPPCVRGCAPTRKSRLEVLFDHDSCVHETVRAVMELLPRKHRVAPCLALVVVQRGRELDGKTRERLAKDGAAVGVHVEEKQWWCRRF